MAGAGEISRNLRFSLVFVPESKSNTHQNWDSWTRTSGMSESKSDALPLGYEAIFEMVEGDGFEPSNPKEQIYSLPRLATSLSFRH